ncbi:hypothetical protein OHA58_07980 [Streptomyces sp. NBC_00009]|jgi:hypothetical protein
MSSTSASVCCPSGRPGPRHRPPGDCHWILEIHLIDRERGFGGFHEEFLDLG